MGWLILIAYGLLINVICVLLRRPTTGDDYLLGGRQFPALFVAFGLFTLVGGGSFVANAALGFVFGIYGAALFVGSGLGFLVLGLMASRVRELYGQYLPISIVDYFHSRFGRLAGWISFVVTFVAFFGLLVMQFIAAGELLAPLLGIPYLQVVVATGVIATSYLVVTGFRAVMSTDLLQGAIIVALIPATVFLARPAEVPASLWVPSAPDWASILGLAFAGFISALASSDIWQRAFAARDARAARTGFIIGAAVISALGVLLVALGVFAAASGSTDPAAAFGQMISSLPAWTATPVALLILTVIMATADTEIFLLGGLTERQLERLQGQPEAELASGSNLGRSRVWVVATAAVAVFGATIFKDLVALYGWLLSLSLVIGPVALASLLFRVPRVVGAGVLVLNCFIFVGAAAYGLVTVDNAYLVALPSTALLLGLWVIQIVRGRMNAGEMQS